MSIVIIVLVALIVLAIVSNIKVVPQAKAYVVERLGAYNATWHTGLHVKVPLVDKVALKVSMKEHVVDFLPQPVITKDNATVEIDTVVYYQVMDPKLFAYGVDQPMVAIENLTATTLRNIIGDLELDACLTSRETINTQIRAILDEATDAWGIKVNRVEVKNIQPPREIQDAMEKQMRAERERREAILKAEGEKKSSVLIAQGEKEAAILKAQADRESNILRAQGEAQAIITKNKAQAQALKLLSDAKASKEAVAIRSLESLEKLGEGDSTKILIPSDIQGVAGLASSLSEVARTPMVKR